MVFCTLIENSSGGAPINLVSTSGTQLTTAETGVKHVYTQFAITPSPTFNSNTAFVPIASFTATGAETEQYYFHPDHLGSSNYITNFVGEVSQHMEYFAFGETFIEEHKNSHNSPYKFNGKELDEESGYSYFGARYLDMRYSIWNSTDPLSGYNPIFEDEHYIDGEHNLGVLNAFNLATYSYCYQNPVRLIDPNGKQVDVVDFIPFVGSSRDIYRGCRDGDWVTLGIGIGGLALDCVTFGSGSIAKGLAKGTGKVLMEGGSKFLINGGYKMSKVEMTIAIKELGLDPAKKYTAKELIDQGAKYSAKYYRQNLQVFTGLIEAAGKDAHHIFPKADKFAEFFSKAGIDVNNPANMKWLESTIHRGKNSAAHLKEWITVMENYAEKGIKPTKELLQKEAKRIEKVFK